MHFRKDAEKPDILLCCEQRITKTKLFKILNIDIDYLTVSLHSIEFCIFPNYN